MKSSPLPSALPMALRPQGWLHELRLLRVELVKAPRKKRKSSAKGGLSAEDKMLKLMTPEQREMWMKAKGDPS